MRVVLADLKGKGGHVSKDTVAGGYGSRFRGTSATTSLIEIFRKIYQNFPSIHTAYLAAIFENAGHEVALTRDEVIPGTWVSYFRQLWITGMRKAGPANSRKHQDRRSVFTEPWQHMFRSRLPMQRIF